MLTDYDLFKNPNKYSIEELENNISHLSSKYLVCTQILTADFCINYILDLDIESGSEDSYLFDKNYILERQPHITEAEFDESYKRLYVPKN